MAAKELLFTGNCPEMVKVSLPGKEMLNIPVNSCGLNRSGITECTVIKDAGDDPDVTHRAVIGSRVSILPESEGIVIAAGEGVGRITKPGLELAPGEPAINPGPRRMIRENLSPVSDKDHIGHGLLVEIFVPRGEILARRTLNKRLGILGGISILGTTGLVKPMSHAAYVATIDSSLAVAKASGSSGVVCTTGRRSERFAQDLFPELPEEAFVQIGDFFARSMQQSVRRSLRWIILVVFFGKALKMAQGAEHTHAAKSTLALEELSLLTKKMCKDPDLAFRVSSSNTAREAFFLLQENCPRVFMCVARKMVNQARKFAGSGAEVRGVILDYEGRVIADTAAESDNNVINKKTNCS